MTFERIDVHDDEDNAGSGELFFEGTVNGLRLTRSDQYDVDSGTSISLGGSRWSKSVAVPVGGSLTIHFEGFDEDVTADESLGSVDASYSVATSFGVGLHTARSSNADFTIVYRITDDDAAAPPGPGRHLRVVFNRVQINDDEDLAGSGELFFWGEVNGASTGISSEYSLDSGSWALLNGTQWSKEVWLPTGATLSIYFSGYDQDATTRDSLGSASVSFTAANNFGIGSHAIDSSNDDFMLEYTVLDPTTPDPPGSRRFLVIFDSVEVHDDEDVAGSGELVFSAEVNGTVVGSRGPDDVDSDDTVTLGWTTSVAVSGTGPVRVFFTAYDEDATTREPLGDVNHSVSVTATFGVGVYSTVSSNGDYTLRYRIVDASLRRLRVTFQSVDIHDDEDTAGSGELFFEGQVNGSVTPRSQQYDRDSGQSIALSGSQWTIDAYLPASDSLRVGFSGFDDDATGTDSLGSLLDRFTAAESYGVGTHATRSSNGDFTVHYAIQDPDAAERPGARRFSVRFDGVDVHSDEDNAGSGELFFSGSVNGSSTGLSEQFDADSGSSIPLSGAQWTVRSVVDAGASLNIGFQGYDEDATTIDPLGTVSDTFTQAQGWGVGPHASRSSGPRDYTLHYVVIDDTAPAAPIQVRVRFRSVVVHSDEDAFGSGELFFRGGANTAMSGLSSQIDADAGETVELSGPNWELLIGLQPTESLSVSFVGFDQDATTTDSLGSVAESFGPGAFWGIGSHSIRSSNGDFTLNYDIEAITVPLPAGTKRYQVVFESVDIVDDEDAFGSGELFFSGTVNGVSTGSGAEMEGASGNTVWLTGSSWARSVLLSPTDTLTVQFSGFDDDATGRESLGATIESFAGPAFGEGSHRTTSSNGDFVVHYRIVDTTRPAYRIKFRKIAVVDDEDVAGSGELFAFGAVNGLPTGHSDQFNRGNGQDIYLGGMRWTKEIHLDPADTLRIEFEVFDDDAFTTESLGEFHTSFSGPGFGTRPTDAALSILRNLDAKAHEAASSSGGFKVRYVIGSP